MEQIIRFNDLKVGQRVKVKGKAGEDGVFVAQEISLEGSSDRAEIKGLIQSINHQKNTLYLLNREFVLPDGVAVKDSQRNTIGLKDLKAGDVVKLKGKYSEFKRFVPEKIKMQETAGFDFEELQGDINKIDREKKTLEVVGFKVVFNEKVTILKFTSPVKFHFQNYGYCYCCNSHVKFVAHNDWWRDYYLCTNCKCIPRERAVMFCIEKFFPNWRDLIIHESSPVSHGASQRLRKEARHYIASQFYPNVMPGTMYQGFRCENLESLTFDDYSIDLHITQDVFEHILNPAAAFKKIARTLKPGGAHLFTTPLVNKGEPTKFCAKQNSDGSIVHLVDTPKYHGNPISPEGSLVTVRWGYDITQYIFEPSGLFTEMIFIDSLEFGIRAEYIEVLITRKPSKQ
jgi:SAM-dependent methyltransferase